MSHRLKLAEIPFYPIVLAAVPPLAVYSIQPSQVMPIDLATAILAGLFAGAMIFAIAMLVMKDLGKAGFAAFLVVFWIYSYGIGNQVNALTAAWGVPPLPHRFWLIAAALIMGGGILWLLRRDKMPTGWTQGLNTFAGCSVLTPTIFLASAGFSTETAFRSTPVSQPPAAPEFELQANEDAPDIYYLVFDRYARGDVLQQSFGYDNGPFLNELKKRGFFVAEASRANYPKTEISMASALNLTLHGETSAPKSHYLNALGEHRVGKLLKEQGYRYYHLGNMLDGLRQNPMADENIRFSNFGCEYHDVMIELTALHPWLTSTGHRGRALAKFDRIPQIAAETDERKFVYAHFLLPHEPWKFDRDGNDPATTPHNRNNRESYVEQLIYTNGRILETIDAINAKSTTPPIIILQADEGPELKYAGDQQLTRLEQTDRRTAILSAFCLPGKEAAAIVADDISPVNTFRIVFREYFAANLTDAPNRTHYWSHPTPLGKPAVTRVNTLIDVTERLSQPRTVVSKL